MISLEDVKKDYMNSVIVLASSRVPGEMLLALRRISFPSKNIVKIPVKYEQDRKCVCCESETEYNQITNWFAENGLSDTSTLYILTKQEMKWN